MSQPKSPKLSAERKLVQRHRVVSVNGKKFLFSIFLNFLCQTAKKIRASRDFYFSTGSGNVVELSKGSLGQSRPSCPREPNVVVWDVTSAGLFSAWHPT
jgi:hypothetical protein